MQKMNSSDITHERTKDREPESRINYFKKLVIQSIIITGIASVVGLVFNAILSASSGAGISLITEYCSHANQETTVEQSTEWCDVYKNDRPFCFVRFDKTKLLMEKGVTFIDARTKEYYEEGHIPKARLLDFYNQHEYIDDALANIQYNDIFVIYCNGGDCEDSELLAQMLYNRGYSQVVVYEGGFLEWLDKNMPYNTGLEP